MWNHNKNISFLTYKIRFPKEGSRTVLLLCIATQQVAGCDETGNENKCHPHTLADHRREFIRTQGHIFILQPATIWRTSLPSPTRPTSQLPFHLAGDSSHAALSTLTEETRQGGHHNQKTPLNKYRKNSQFLNNNSNSKSLNEKHLFSLRPKLKDVILISTVIVKLLSSNHLRRLRVP